MESATILEAHPRRTALPAKRATASPDDLAWATALGLLWLWTWRQLAITWLTAPNYQFGFTVPLLAIFLAIRATTQPVSTHQRTSSPLTGFGMVAAWTIFLFAELVRQFDPHWRLVGWAMIFSITLLTAIALHRRGGFALLRAFAFPLAFTWTAVPWPTSIEEIITQHLRLAVTRAAVLLLHAAGIHVTQHGNVMDLASGSVVIDSACSGISSLQVSIMAGLFLGQYFTLTTIRRVLLVLTGAALATIANLLRATLLAWLAARGGSALLLAWHDTLGRTETIAIFAGLILAAWAFSRIAIPPRQTPTTTPTATTSRETPAPQRRAYSGITFLTSLAVFPLLTSLWFSLSPGGPIRTLDAPRWNLRSAAASPDWHIAPVTLSPLDLQTLDFTQGQSIQLSGPAAASAVIYHFFWKTDASTGYGHTPDHCLAAAGWQQIGQPVMGVVSARGISIPVKQYRFRLNSDEQVIYQAVWYGGDPMISAGEFPYSKGGPRTSRLAMLWSEPRRRGLEALTLYMPPQDSPQAQTQLAETILTQTLTND